MTERPTFDPFAALAAAKQKNPLSQSPKTFAELSQASHPPINEEIQRVSDNFAAFAAFAGGAHAHTSSRGSLNIKKERYFSLSLQGFSHGEGALVADPTPVKTCSGAGTPAKVAILRSRDLSDCFSEETRKRLAAKVSQPTPAAREQSAPAPHIERPRPVTDTAEGWLIALTRLGGGRTPCPGYRSGEWIVVHARALAFLDAFGEQAEALGWTASRLFGVHREAGIVRGDQCGGLILPIGGAVRAITATEIRFGHLTHRIKPGQPQGVPIWEFGR